MTLLHAMGSEAANVHLGDKRQRKKILRDLQKRKSAWLRSAAKEMAKAVERDWEKYRRHQVTRAITVSVLEPSMQSPAQFLQLRPHFTAS
jgi:hypothetical protein